MKQLKIEKLVFSLKDSVKFKYVVDHSQGRKTLLPHSCSHG